MGDCPKGRCEMRIKFRSWDYRNKVMDFPDHIANDIDGDKYQIQMFTGLKDKNDKEIYEGDILLVEMDGDLQAVYELVRWDDCGWEPWLSGVADRYFRITQCEVIGNIYENGDLLCDTSEH